MMTTQTARTQARSDSIRKAALTIMPPDGDHVTCRLPVLTRATGALVTDADGNEYIDYAGTDGATILGHADGRVTVAIHKAAAKGVALGSLTESQVRLAEIVTSWFPAIDFVRFTPSTSEARSGAIACAKVHTQRERILTCTLHGGRRDDHRPLRLNDTLSLSKAFDENGPSIAAVIVEPVATNTGLVPADQRYLSAMRTVCDEHGAMLVFDESTTAFRIAATANRPWGHVMPDLTVIGRTAGGGLPLAAFGGGRAFMLSASPRPAKLGREAVPGLSLSVAAGLSALEALAEPGFFEHLDALARRLDEGLLAAAAPTRRPTQHARFATMVGMYFSEMPCKHASFARTLDETRFSRFHEAMLDRGILLPASATACYHVCAAHTAEQIDRTIEAARDALEIAGAVS